MSRRSAPESVRRPDLRRRRSSGVGSSREPCIFTPKPDLRKAIRLVHSAHTDLILCNSELNVKTRRKPIHPDSRLQAVLLDAVEQAVVATDLRGHVIYWNAFAERLYGWSAAEVMDANL